MKKKLLHNLGLWLGGILFAISLWVLHHELKEYHYQDIILSLKSIPSARLFFAILLTITSYFILTLYDVLAFRYIQNPLIYRKIVSASFIGYAFSNNLGAALITGGSVRFRLFAAWGLSAVEIIKVIAFCSLTFWLGFLTLGGFAFLLKPFIVPVSLHIPIISLRSLGLIFLLIVCCYLLMSAVRKKPFKIRELEFSLPPLRLTLAQIGISCLDWALAAAVLYFLLPTHTSTFLSYQEFLGIFLLAQIAGIASQVPGGLGVFETIMVLLLSNNIQASVVLGSLVAFRGIYYILPLGISVTLLGIHEVKQRKEGIQKVTRTFGQWVPALVPHVLSFTTFMGGVILLFSGAIPAVGTRMAWLKDIIPLPVIELSHFLGSLAGAGLIILARALQRRIDAAYILTLVLLGGGTAFSLLKGADYEEAVILAVMFFALLPCHRYFYRRSSLLDVQLSPGWVMAITLVITGSLWIGFFSHKHVEYSHELWWQFEFAGDAPRFLRASVGVMVIFLFYSSMKLLSPVKPRPSVPAPAELEKVWTIASISRSTTAYLALLGDKALLFSGDEKAFLMYAVEDRSWISMGDPIGHPEAKKELVWQFREMCDRHDGWTVFYEVRERNRNLYIDLGLTFLKLGEEGRVNLRAFSLEGGSRKEFRNTIHKLDKQGCSFEIIPREGIPPLLPELKVISDAWLSEKHTGEKGFSLGFFKPDYLRYFPAAVVRQGGKIQAFANIWPGGEKEELSIDLMRYRPEAPHGTMDYLFVKLMLWGKQEGYQWFSLGMAPFSGLDEHSLAPLWNRLGVFLYRHGEHFYNFQGLRYYKEKFDPEWESRYLIVPGGFALPRILINIASLVSRGLKGIVAK